MGTTREVETPALDRNADVDAGARSLRGPKSLEPEIELSIVIPCLNEAATLGECIRAAQEGLRALSIDGEIIVADNGSTDGSPDIAEALGARVVRVDLKGYGAALLGGIAAARGEFIIMGDADATYDFRAIGPFI